MQLFRLITISVLMVSSIAIHNASALTIDQNTGTNVDGSSKFVDPDDKIPFPHVADDGDQSSNNSSNSFQSSTDGNGGVYFGLTPSNGDTDAFHRAQERMQQ